MPGRYGVAGRMWRGGYRERRTGVIEQRDAGTLVEGTLVADYTLTRHACTGEWVAIGHIVSASDASGWRSPAWISVGVAETRGQALDDLRAHVRHEADLLAHHPVGIAIAH